MVIGAERENLNVTRVARGEISRGGESVQTAKRAPRVTRNAACLRTTGGSCATTSAAAGAQKRYRPLIVKRARSAICEGGSA